MYVSPGEPVFWLHHGQLDRHWWMWANYLEAQVKSRVSMYDGEWNGCLFILYHLLRMMDGVLRFMLTNDRWNELDESRVGEGEADR